jgi:hypothetical protein
MPFGLRLVRVSGQGENQGGTQDYDVDPDDATPIYRGDPVTLTGGFIALAAAGDEIVGVFNGCQYNEVDGYKFRSYWPGAGAVTGPADVQASITGWEGSRYYIELAVAEGDAVRTMVGTRRNHLAGVGSPVYGDSRVTLGAADVAGSFFVNQLADLPGNAFGAPSQVFEVTVALPQRYA